MRIDFADRDERFEKWAALLAAAPLSSVRLSPADIVVWENTDVPRALDAAFLDQATCELEAASVAPEHFASRRVQYLRGLAALASYIFSWVTDADRARTCFTFIYWAFLTDDEIDCVLLPSETEEAAAARVAASRRQLKAVLAGWPPPTGGPERSLVRYTRRFRDLLERHSPSPAWLRRCITDLQLYLDGTATAFTWWQRGEVPTIAEYLLYRLYDVGAYPTADLVELGLGFALDEAILRLPAVRQLRICCLLHATLTNDLYSHKRERDEQRTAWNIVEVLHHRLGLDDAAAIDRVVRLMNEMGEAMRSRTDFLACLGANDVDQLRRYFAAMENLMMGWVSYVRDAERFRGYHDPLQSALAPGTSS